MNSNKSTLSAIIQKASQKAPLAEKALRDVNKLSRPVNICSSKKLHNAKNQSKTAQQRWVNLKLTQQQDDILSKIAYERRYPKRIIILQALTFLAEKYRSDFETIPRPTDDVFSVTNGGTKSLMLSISEHDFERLDQLSKQSRYSKKELVLIALYEFFIAKGFLEKNS